MTRGFRTLESGSVSMLLIATIVLGLLTAGGIAGTVYYYMNYNEQKTNVDQKISLAEAKAQKTQADTDEAKFNERDKQPFRQFVGPNDYGRLTFQYPKTWSVFVYKDVVNSGDTYQAYLNPVSVPPISTVQQYALRVTIQTADFSTILSAYNGLVKTGALQQSTVTIGSVAATRLDGAFNTNVHGSLVIFKIRDKTVTIQTDATTFKSDFDALISTIKFNQ